MSFYHRDNCRLCFGRRLECVFPLKASPPADAFVPASRLSEPQDRYPMDLYLCLDCGHAQLLDVVSPDLLFRSYLYETSTSLGLVAHFKQLADEMAGNLGLSKGSLVADIGSNDGSLLAAFQELGMKGVGIDPARGVAERANARGVYTLAEFFTAPLARQLRSDHGPASLITANNVFAHADDLESMLIGVRDWLSPDGVFAFEVSYLPDVMERWLFDTIYHEHLCYHSLNPLVSFLGRAGMEIFGIKRLRTKGGSLRVLAKLADGPWPVSAEVLQLARWERAEGWHRPETFAKYVAGVEQKRRETIEALCELKAAGKEIIGYGASHTVTTLLHQWDLAPFLSCLVDDNPRKQGLFSPGHHLPVHSPDILYRKPEAVVMILAWQYASAIQSRRRFFLDAGGAFFIPLPTAHFVTGAGKNGPAEDAHGSHVSF